MTETYRGWSISFDYPPIPVRSFDYSATHPDYDGHGDDRHVRAETREGVMAEIDAWILENSETTQPEPPVSDRSEPVLPRDESDFQGRVRPWLLACFGKIIADDREERNHRFLEEALELVQATGCTASEAHHLVDYVYGRPVGEPAQEVGGVMVTLAALCLANGINMHDAGEVELARIWTKVEAIRAKQAAKPKHSPLPMSDANREAVEARKVVARCIEIIRDQQATFLSIEYSTGQPLASFQERFACGQCAEAIEREFTMGTNEQCALLGKPTPARQYTALSNSATGGGL